MEFIGNAANNMRTFEAQINQVSQNLGNLQTTGYRAQRMDFQASAGGGTSSTLAVDSRNGQMQGTSSPSDLAVNGSGHFILRNADGTTQYTRDGSFQLDASGILRGGSNDAQVMGWAASGGVVATSSPLSPIRIPLGTQVSSHGSTTITAGGNLDASAAVYVPASGSTAESGGVLRVDTQAYDAQGTAHTVSVTFTKTAPNTWAWSAAAGDASTLSPAQGQITFDGSGASTAGTVSLSFNPAGSAAQAQTVTLDLSPLQQTAGASTATVQADAFQTGTLSSYTVGTDGTITGHYSTGTTAVIGRVALARFTSPDGLRALGANMYAATDASGAAMIGTAGQGAFGSIEQGNLEGSNVDMTVEFSRLIIAQRAYQANSRLLSTGDQMWQDLLDLKR